MIHQLIKFLILPTIVRITLTLIATSNFKKLIMLPNKHLMATI